MIAVAILIGEDNSSKISIFICEEKSITNFKNKDFITTNIRLDCI